MFYNLCCVIFGHLKSGYCNWPPHWTVGAEQSRVRFWQSQSHKRATKYRSKRKVNKDGVGELGEERSDSRRQLIVCVKYNPPGIRNINDVKCCVWDETQRADRK